mgnify:CR=1 FL=1
MRAYFTGGNACGGGVVPTHRKIYEDSTCALLRMGMQDRWTAASYLRIANYFDGRDPIACLFWEREARRHR